MLSAFPLCFFRASYCLLPASILFHAPTPIPKKRFSYCYDYTRWATNWCFPKNFACVVGTSYFNLLFPLVCVVCNFMYILRMVLAKSHGQPRTLGVVAFLRRLKDCAEDAIF